MSLDFVRSNTDSLRESVSREKQTRPSTRMDAYFSADVETDGPIPGPYSILSFALVFAGTFDGNVFRRPPSYDNYFYAELKPISTNFEHEALKVNRIDRDKLMHTGLSPESAMENAARWVLSNSGPYRPVLVAYPLSFDWTWLYWYFVRFCREGSPFDYSRCFDIKTAVAVKTKSTISDSSRSRLPPALAAKRPHTHHAIDDATEQAEIFANVFEWER